MNSYSEASRVSPSFPILDRIYVLVPTFACYYAVVIGPLLLLAFPAGGTGDEVAGRPEHRIFWIMLGLVTMALTIHHRGRLLSLRPPPSLYVLLLYLIWAGASVSWALEPAISLKRYVLQLLVVLCATIPPLVSGNKRRILKDLFICFSISSILNILSLALRPPTELGYAGLFGQKNTLGEVAGISLVFALYGLVRFRGWIRGWAFLQCVLDLALLVASQSKTSALLALVAPLLAAFVILAAVYIRTAPLRILALLTASCVSGYVILSDVLQFSFGDVSSFLFGDTTFTGRTLIWSFASEMIEKRPVLGYGYQSFWLIGPSSPSVTEGPGWVKDMPHAHSGYVDTTLETGFIGLAILCLLILSNLAAIGRSLHQDTSAAWLALSMTLFTIAHNCLETSWCRSFSIQWLIFLILTVTVANRDPQPLVQDDEV